MFGPWTKHLLILTALMAGGCVTGNVHRDSAVMAESRAVEFLKCEVPAWSRDNGCFSCHNNGDGARALYAATRKGYGIPARVLADTTAWVANPNRWEHNKGDPGFSDQRLANIQFAASLLAAVETGHVQDRLPLQEAARKVAADQDVDGSWPIEPQNAVGSPATYGTLLATYMALRTLKQAEAPGTSEMIRKAENWLQGAQPNNILTAATLLLAATRDDVQERSKECLDLIRRAQTREGGWGPYADSPPEPFDTAVVLLALAELRRTDHVGGDFQGCRHLDELIQWGRTFLAAQQNPDGSWPATTRPPGGNSYAQRVSTTGWATLALLATRESP